MSIEELGVLASRDGAPMEYLTQLAQCEVSVETADALEIKAPTGSEAPLLAHSIGILAQKRTTVGNWTHNPWTVGICCKPVRLEVAAA